MVGREPVDDLGARANALYQVEDDGEGDKDKELKGHQGAEHPGEAGDDDGVPGDFIQWTEFLGQMCKNL